MNQFEQIAQVQVEAIKESERRKLEVASIRQNERQEEAVRKDNAEKLRDLNKARRETTTGNKPVEIWGEEVQQLCDEFLEFAGSVSVRGGVYPGAKLLTPPTKKVLYEAGPKGLFRRKPLMKTRHIKSDWSIKGYGIAYSKDYISKR